MAVIAYQPKHNKTCDCCQRVANHHILRNNMTVCPWELRIKLCTHSYPVCGRSTSVRPACVSPCSQQIHTSCCRNRRSLCSRRTSKQQTKNDAMFGSRQNVTIFFRVEHSYFHFVIRHVNSEAVRIWYTVHGSIFAIPGFDSRWKL